MVGRDNYGICQNTSLSSVNFLLRTLSGVGGQAGRELPVQTGFSVCDTMAGRTWKGKSAGSGDSVIAGR